MYHARFIDGNKNTADGWRAISPLFTFDRNNVPALLGSAFFISKFGAMLTARHCLSNNSGLGHRALFILQFLNDDRWLIRKIWAAYSLSNADIAVLLPQHFVHNETREGLSNPVFKLTTRHPPKGETVATFSYSVEIMNEKTRSVDVTAGERWHFGQIEDFHENGVSLIRNSCFQTSMPIPAGSSGGPVVDATGNVFAINSSGSDSTSGENAYSLLTPIEHAFNIQVEGPLGEKYSIRELIQRGDIICK